jgi:hypothetical protein
VLACACGQTSQAARPPIALKVSRNLIAILTSTPVASKGGVVALRCPTCNGPLTLAEGSETATCKYCQGSALVVRPTVARKPTDPTRAPGCWLLFSKT